MQGWRWLKRWLQAVAACALAASAALAQQPGPDPIAGIYRGTLGKEEIVLEAGATASRAAGLSSSYFTGRYFYRRYGVPIFLYGHLMSDGRIVLREYRGADLTDNQLRLRFHGDKATGIFCRCKDETREPVKGELKIRLTRVSSGFDPEWKDSENPPDQAYYDLLLGFPQRTGPEMRVSNGMAYEVQSDPRFQIGMPRLTRFPDATVLAKVNEDLAGELKKGRLWISDCLSGDERGGSYEEKINVTALTDVVFSVVIERWYYCGGAHPDYEMDTLTYDMKTGKRFRLYGLLYDEVRPEKPRKYAMYENPLPLVLADLYLRHYAPFPGVKIEDCDFAIGIGEDGDSHLVSTFSRWPDTVLFLGHDGLTIMPVLMHALQGCGPAITIPYREILPMVEKHGRFRAMVESIVVQR